MSVGRCHGSFCQWVSAMSLSVSGSVPWVSLSVGQCHEWHRVMSNKQREGERGVGVGGGGVSCTCSITAGLTAQWL